MGYGFGVLLAAIGLVLIYALEIDIPGVGDNTLGWIFVVAGVVVIVLTAVQLNAKGRSRSTATTTHADGSQTVQQRSTDTEPPAV